MKLEKREKFTEKIIVNATTEMKEALQALASKNEREFSDFIRMQWKKLIAKPSKN